MIDAAAVLLSIDSVYYMFGDNSCNTAVLHDNCIELHLIAERGTCSAWLTVICLQLIKYMMYSNNNAMAWSATMNCMKAIAS